MPKLVQIRTKKLIATLATIALIVQVVLPGGLFNFGIRPVLADDAKTWGFTTAANYTLGDGATVGDTFAFAELDLTAASDNLDSYGPTTDLIETATVGRILAGTSTYLYPSPYSTDYGDTWDQPSVGISGGEISNVKFTKTANRIIGVGFNDGTPVGGWSYSTDNGASWTGHTAVAGSTKWGAVYYESNNDRIWAGTNDADNEIYYSTDNGASFYNADQGDLSNATDIHEIIASSDGSIIYAAATISGASSTSTSIFYTTDSGSNWTETTKASGSTHATVYDLAIDLNGYVYAITSGTYILKSDDPSGTVFSEISITGLSAARSIYADARGGIIIPDDGGNIYRSFDGGSNFVLQNLAAGMSDIVYAHAIIRTSDTFVYLLGTEGPASSGNAYSGNFNNTQNETTGPIVTTNSGTGVAFSSISAFLEVYPSTSETITGVKYRITNDDNQATWYYWNTTNWVTSSGLADMNTVSVVDANIGQFDDDVGSGTFHFQAYVTNASGSHANSSVALGSVSITYVGHSLTITAPDTNTDWDIGDTESITWTVGGDVPDHYDLYYAEREDEGAWGSWLQSNANMDNYTTSGTSYAWEIPVVNYPHSTYKNYKVKVESYTSGDVMLASGESGAFKIDYGPVASFVVDAPTDWPEGDPFPLTVTALDQYSNTITNFNSTVTISAAPGPISPTTIGDGTYGSWADGSVSYNGYVIKPIGEHTITASYGGATGQDTILIKKKGGGGGDTTKPVSKVLGILENGKIVVPRKPLYYSPVSIIGEASDSSGIKSVELYYLRKEMGGGYKNYGSGTRIFLDGDLSKPYWTWSFDIKLTGGDGTYYFYSIATDHSGNIEDPKKKPELTLICQGTQPKIYNTNPRDKEENIGILSDIVVSFDKPMDTTSVENAFCFSENSTDSTIPFSCDDWDYWGWNVQWRLNNTVATFSHSQPFEYLIAYRVWINPDIAKDKYGVALDPISDVPNPWVFTTTFPQDPDLSNSKKEYTIYDSGTGLQKDEANPGDIILYTITLWNTSKWADSDTIITDVIPINTTFADYMFTNPPSFQAHYDSPTNSIIGSGVIPKLSQAIVKFQVRIDSPLPDRTEIKNTVKIDDGNGVIHYKSCSTLVKSSPDWAASKKEASPTIAKVGDTLTYTITLDNSGDMDATNVSVTDRIPDYTDYVEGSATGGLEYNPAINTLSWEGTVNANDPPKIFTFQVTVASQPSTDKVVNTATITDENGSYNRVIDVTIIPDDSTPPYIIAVAPDAGATNVKLFSPIVVTFSDSIKTDTLEYKVSAGTSQFNEETGERIYEVVYDTTQGDSSWTETWSSNTAGKANAKVSIQPDKPLRSGTNYIVKVLDAVSTNGKHLISDNESPIPNNEWSFTTLRPALVFEKKGLLSLKADTPSPAINIKLVNWTNFDDPGAVAPNYEPYQVEDPNGLLVRLIATSRTGKFDTDQNGDFDGSIINVFMAQGQDTATFFYKEPLVTYPTLYWIYIAPSASVTYVIYGDERPVVTTADGEILGGDQIFFKTGAQSVPVGKLSEPITFGIYSPGQEWVTLKKGDAFLLGTDSATGQFYNRYGNPIQQYATYQTGAGIKRGYLLTMDEDRIDTSVYYAEFSIPGAYLLTIEDKSGVASSSLRIAAGGGAPANQGEQDIYISPIEDQDLEELEEELEEVEDETERIIDRIVIEPDDTVVLPGALRTFIAQGFDTEGQVIENLKFSWYVIGGGGSILKKGSDTNGHSTAFTAGRIPGVYTDTVLVATLYNGTIKAAMATVRVADVVDYGGPGRLPSTGPNGIQLLFIGLTLISAVALAAVEHYEKTHLSSEGQKAS